MLPQMLKRKTDMLMRKANATQMSKRKTNAVYCVVSFMHTTR